MKLVAIAGLAGLLTGGVAHAQDSQSSDRVPPPPPGFVVVEGAGSDWYADPVVALPAPWEHLEVGGWTYEGMDEEFVMFTQLARGPNRIWARYEYAEPNEQGVLSERHLTELDCRGWRTLRLQIYLFPESNLAGIPVANSELEGQWSYAAPDTIAEVVLQRGCPN